ncbi:MAG: ferredoxin--NADP reductase [Proteobacteria bacterium]|nr:ferredoxin--NADP reductase [Pseudomonadota bacterium]
MSSSDSQNPPARLDTRLPQRPPQLGLERGGVEIAGPWFPLRIARVIPETPDARSLVLEVPEALRERFAYRAGQFLSFRIAVDGARLVRCYSLASSPDTETEHKVTVKRVEDGRVSNWINDALREGDVLEVMRPAGLFCLRKSDAVIVLFSGGSGITPVISIVKSALATTERRVKLVYANRDRESIIFADELASLAARHPDRFELVHRLDVEEGFVDGAAVARYAGADVHADHYICGPGPFMETVESTLLDLGAAAERIFIERFELDPAAPSEPGAIDLSVPGAASAERVVIRLDGREREMTAQPGRTLLQLAREAGMEPPFACEEGYCGSCMAQLVRGTVHMKANDVLDETDLAEGLILTCQSVPTAPVVEVEYPD